MASAKKLAMKQVDASTKRHRQAIGEQTGLLDPPWHPFATLTPAPPYTRAHGREWAQDGTGKTRGHPHTAIDLQSLQRQLPLG